MKKIIRLELMILIVNKAAYGGGEGDVYSWKTGGCPPPPCKTGGCPPPPPEKIKSTKRETKHLLAF